MIELIALLVIIVCTLLFASNYHYEKKIKYSTTKLQNDLDEQNKSKNILESRFQNLDILDTCSSFINEKEDIKLTSHIAEVIDRPSKKNLVKRTKNTKSHLKVV